MPAIANARTRSEESFTRRQEWYRKDIERAFGVSQLRFKIVKHAARSWSSQKMGDVMIACCVLHNMILDDRSLLIQDETAAMMDAVDRGHFQVRPSLGMNQARVVDTYLRNTRLMCDSARHEQRKLDRLNHLFHLYDNKLPPFARRE